mgnify:CR=1 FL=1
MAENKKSFIAYCDWGEIFGMLTDEEAGKMIKHLFAYVNDRNPKFEEGERILKIAFEPIKLQLKRDLTKYEEIREKRIEAGRSGGKKSGKVRKQKEANEASASNSKQKEANEAVNVNVNDNVTVNDNDIIKEKIYKKEIAFKKSIEPFIERYGKETCNNFFLYWTEPNKSKTKLRYEMEKTWDISRRLANWARNEKNFKGNGKTEITTKKYEQLG